MTALWQLKSAAASRHGAAAMVVLASWLGLAEAAGAAEVRVVVSGLRNEQGTIYVAICTAGEFLRPACSHVGSAPASTGAVTVAGVPPGTYAVQAIHDENGNQQLDRSGFLPSEGMGFSRDAPMRRGPPRFADAAFDLTEAGAVVPLTMRYFQ